jgi:hypothetical protein
MMTRSWRNLSRVRASGPGSGSAFPQHLGRCATPRLARLGPESRRVPSRNVSYLRWRPTGRLACSQASYAPATAATISTLAPVFVRASVIASSRPADIRGLCRYTLSGGSVDALGAGTDACPLLLGKAAVVADISARLLMTLSGCSTRRSVASVQAATLFLLLQGLSIRLEQPHFSSDRFFT